MRSKGWLASCVIAALLVFFLAGCATDRAALIVKNDPFQIQQKEGLTVSLRYLDDATLKDKYGRTSNPFITRYETMQFNRIMVFELTMKGGDAPRYLQLDYIQMQFGGKFVQPINPFHLSEYWEIRDRYTHELSPDTRRKQTIAQKEVVPNDVFLDTGASYVRLLVFMESFPLYGKCTINLPLLEAKNAPPKEMFIFEFEF